MKLARGPARWLGDVLASARARWFVPLVAMLLTAPSLAGGLFLDDALHRLKARGAFGADLASRLDLFVFVPGTPAGNARLFDVGYLPWFASRDLRLAFLRPISALSAFFDYTVLDRWRWAMHAESLAIYALVVVVAAAAYRRLLPAPVAALAALLFAVDYGHVIPVAWLANRNSLFATGFVLAAWIAHDRWRRDGWRPGAVLGPIAFVAALLSAEIALCGFAYFVAYAFTLDPAASKARRAWALAPYAALIVTWQAVYRTLGYGARGSSLYIDPFASPGPFLRAAPGRAVSLLVAQLGTPPSDFWFFLPPPARVVFVILALAFLAFVAGVLLPSLRREPVVRFFALGTLLAVPPVLATVASDRLLVLVGFGAFGVMAHVIGDLRVEPADASRSSRALRRVWIAFRLVVSPLVLLVACNAGVIADAFSARAFGALHLGPELAHETLIVANVPDAFFAYPIFYPSDDAHPTPHRVRLFASTRGHVTLAREDARTVLVEIADDAPEDPLVHIFRDDRDPVHVGDVFDVTGMRAELVRIDGAGVTRAVRYRFDADLDDPSFRWVAWNGDQLVDYARPAIGARVVVGPP